MSIRPPDKIRSAGPGWDTGASKQIKVGKLDSHVDTPTREDLQVFVDRFGHRHSAAILTNWSPAAIKAMGIRPFEEGGTR
jgi:hypothetical protein